MLRLYENGMLSEDFRKCSLWFNYVILWELDRRPQFKQICFRLCLLLKINAFFKTSTNGSLLTRCNIKLPCYKRPFRIDTSDLLIAGERKPFHPVEGNVEMDILPILVMMTAHFSVYKAPSHALSPLSLITTLRGQWRRHYCYNYAYDYPYLMSEKARVPRFHSHQAAKEGPTFQLTKFKPCISVSKKSFW